MATLFSVSDEFRFLCTKAGITSHRINVTLVYALCCSVLKNSGITDSHLCKHLL